MRASADRGLPGRNALLAMLAWVAAPMAAAADLSALMRTCSPTVHPETMARIVHVESRGRQFAIADAGPEGLPWSIRKHLVRSHFPATKAAAEVLARRLVDAGHVVSIGLTQVSSRNLPRLGMSIADALDPCINLQLGGRILTEFYVAALPRHGGNRQKALVAAISAYNTGDYAAGVVNGYVGQVLASQPAASVQTSGASP